MGKTDTSFGGAVPQHYQDHLVPLIFEPYAEDLVKRLSAYRPKRILEVAAGTGVVTRRLSEQFGPDVALVATDLNQAMLDQAMAIGSKHPVDWRQADAMQLPFPDESFDAVICQFGAMFFPDKAKAFAEMRRVLRPGGVLLFNVWDRIEENELPNLVTQTLASLFPQDPPRFMARIPHGYPDPAIVARDLAAGGFAKPSKIETVKARSRADSARAVAVAFCRGTPLGAEIAERDASRFDETIHAVATAIARRYGSGQVDAPMQAHVFIAEK